MLVPRENLVKARKEKGLTQRELASQANISRAYLSHLESGKYKPSLNVAKRLSDILRLSVDDLFF